MKATSLPQHTSKSQFFSCLIIVVGAVTFAWAVVQILAHPPKLDWLILSMVTILVGSRASVWFPRGLGKITVSDLFLFFSLLYYGIAPATVLAVIDGLYSSQQNSRNRALTILFNSAVMGLSVFSAGWLGHLALGGADISAQTPLESLLARLLIMASAHYLINSWLAATALSLRCRSPLVQTWSENFRWVAITYFSSAAAAGIAFRLTDILSVYSFLIIVPIIAVTYLTYKGNLEKVEAAQRHTQEVAQIHIETIEALATAIDAKDQTTHEHVRRVQIYAAGLARIFGLSEAEVEALRAGALLHDVGKLAVPDHILNKPGKLTPAEFEKMKIHTTVGSQILERIGFPYPVVPIVRYHHERWDGKGYPEGLQGEQIPMTARILSVVDCFDAVREDRPYRCGLTREQACHLLINGSGKHFDPQVVETFLLHLPEFEREIAAIGAPIEPSVIKGAKRSSSEDGLAAAHARRAGERHYLDQIKSAHHEIYALYEIARTFSSTLNLEDTISIFVNKLKHIVPFDTCAIYLYDEEGGVATLEQATGKHAEAFAGRRIFPGDGVTGWVLANRKLFCNTDPYLDLTTLKIDRHEFKTMAAVPLLKDELMIGVIALYSATVARYSDDHVRLLETISRLAADSFYNALNHAAAQEHALTDPLTGMPNSRALYLQFEQEANRASRQHTPFCVLMMDLDGFKKINDTYGHQVGDEFLIEISRVIAAEMRSYDFLVRYAGDEFVAILPGTTEADLDELTERIVHAVEGFSFPVREQQSIGVGISIGAARYQAEGTSLERLLRIADRRMYKNKQLRKHHFVIEAGEAGAEVLSLSTTIR